MCFTGEFLDRRRPQGLHWGPSVSAAGNPPTLFAAWPSPGDPQRAETAHARGGTVGRGATSGFLTLRTWMWLRYHGVCVAVDVQVLPKTVRFGCLQMVCHQKWSVYVRKLGVLGWGRTITHGRPLLPKQAILHIIDPVRLCERWLSVIHGWKVMISSRLHRVDRWEDASHVASLPSGRGQIPFWSRGFQRKCEGLSRLRCLFFEAKAPTSGSTGAVERLPLSPGWPLTTWLLWTGTTQCLRSVAGVPSCCHVVSLPPAGCRASRRWRWAESGICQRSIHLQLGR